MPYRFNPLTSNLDLVNDTSGFVVGPASATDTAIARYDGTTGKLIQDSIATVQDGGAVAAQGFLTNRVINELVVIPTDYTMLVTNVEIELGEIQIETDAELVII